MEKGTREHFPSPAAVDSAAEDLKASTKDLERIIPDIVAAVAVARNITRAFVASALEGVQPGSEAEDRITEEVYSDHDGPIGPLMAELNRFNEAAQQIADALES